MDLIEVYINDNLVEVEKGEVIALSFAIAKIGEPQFVQSNLSNQIKAPHTKQNKATFDESEQINNLSSFPYSLGGLKIKQNGVWILTNGYAILEDFSDGYNFSILSGNIDFFDAIGDLSIRDLDLTACLHTWNRSNAATKNSATTGYAYPVLDYGALPDSEAADEVDTRYQFPCLHFSALVGAIATRVLADQTIVLSYADLLAEDLFDEMLLTTATDDTNIDYSQFFRDKAEVLVTESGGQTIAASTEDKLTGFSVTSGASARWDNPNQNYTTSYACEVTFTFNATVSTLPSPNLVFFVVKDETVSPAVELGRVAVNAALTDYSVSVEIDETITDVGFYIDNTSPSSSTGILANTFIDITIPEQNVLTYGRTFDFNAVLADISCTDFIKNVAFMFGCIFQTNTLTQTVTIKRFDTITDNKGSAKDWSSKVDFRQSPTIYYRLEDYAQTNNFNYLEDEAVAVNTGRGQILISDEVLEKEADIIDLEFAASTNANYFTFIERVAICKVFSSLGVSPLEYERDFSPEARVIQRVESTGNNVDFTDGSGTTAVNDVVVGQFTTALNWSSLLTNYWVTIKNILEGKVKKLELYLRLTELDIQALDFFTPVYINQSDPISGLSINGYFYIEEIKEFKAGESTEVVLVKLA